MSYASRQPLNLVYTWSLWGFSSHMLPTASCALILAPEHMSHHRLLLVPHHSLLVTIFLSCLKASESLSNHFLFSISVTPSGWRHLPPGQICLLFMWCSIAIHHFNKVSTLPLHVLQLHQKWFIIGRIHGKSCRQADFFVISAIVTASFFALCHISRLWWRCLNGSVFRRDIMFLLASDMISQTIRGDWCTKYSSPLSIRISPFWGYCVQLLLNPQPLIAKWLVCWCP